MSGYARMLLAVAVLLLVLGLALTGCRKDNGGGSGDGGFGYLPAPTRVDGAALSPDRRVWRSESVDGRPAADSKP